MDPYRWQRVWINDFESFGTCGSAGDVTWKVCFSLIAILNAIAMILANCQAYQTRHLSTSFGESKYVALAMACILQITIVGIPLRILVNDNPGAAYFMSTSMVFIISFSILALIFIPKLLHFWRGDSKPAKVRINGVTLPNDGTTRNGTAATYAVPKQEKGPDVKPVTQPMRQSNSRLSVRELQKRELAVHHDMKLNGLKMKIQALRAILESENVDAAAIFRQVGLEE